VYCRNEKEARTVREALAACLAGCRLKLHPTKTKVVGGGDGAWRSVRRGCAPHESSPSLWWDWRRDARARSDAVEPDRLYFSALVNGSSRRIHATTWGNGPNEGGRKPKPAAFSVECASMTSRTSG
jgi:hypothetical protein